MSELYLVLEDGMSFMGEGFGAECDKNVMGEAAFFTGMTGFMETLTDKRALGLVMVQTFPLAGNYGIIPDEAEDGGAPCAYVVRQWCQAPSNYKSEGTLDTFLKDRLIVGLCGVDTRRLTSIIRERGAMNACITRDPNSVDLELLKAHKMSGAVSAVSVKEPVVMKSGGKLTVAALDLGHHRESVNALRARGCDVVLLPHDAEASVVMSYSPDGVYLSGGPGAPEENEETIKTVKALEGTPMLGVGLGHQIMALANGFSVVRLPQAHRGGNQPVRCFDTGRVYITSQNHGYAVDAETANMTFVNVNDNSCEGLEYSGKRAFSVQFTPDSGGSPQDTSFLYDRFIRHMEEAHAQRL